MKSLVTAIAATAFLASGASAFVWDVDVDDTTYGQGDDVTIDLTLMAEGTEQLGSFEQITLEAVWDPTVLAVANAGELFPEGHGEQEIFPELLGSPTPQCSAGGSSCAFVNQSAEIGGATIEGSVTASLVLRVIGGSGPLRDFLQLPQEDIGVPPLPPPNLSVAEIVPEPTTLALVGFALIALASSCRRT